MVICWTALENYIVLVEDRTPSPAPQEDMYRGRIKRFGVKLKGYGQHHLAQVTTVIFVFFTENQLY